MQIDKFTKENTLIYKGIGILHILFHNFFRWLPPVTGENECDFDPDRIWNLIHGFIQQPLECINLFFSYFSYGHTIFIFISGVGLTLSMQNRNRSWSVFMMERLKKLYPLMIVGFVFLFFYEIILYGQFLKWVHYQELLYKLLFVHTFNVTDGSAVSLVGPWWFFGLIFQLYVVFMLLYKVIKKYRIKAFIVICIFSYTWIFISQYIYQPQANILLLQHAPGHLPELAFGILIALSPGKKIHNIWLLLSFAVFIIGCFFKPFYPFTFLTVIVTLYWVFSKIIPYILNKTKLLKDVLLYFGSISMILFAIHGPLRFRFFAISGDTFYSKLFAFVLFVITVTVVSILGNMLYKWLLKRIDSFSFKSKKE